jgi:hypothetical protein
MHSESFVAPASPVASPAFARRQRTLPRRCHARNLRTQRQSVQRPYPPRGLRIRSPCAHRDCLPFSAASSFLRR